MRRQAPGIAYFAAVAALTAAAPAHASLFSGDTLDFVADIMAWVVLIIAPVIAIAVFWLVHILPEKIAENRHHPQAAAIKTLCLLSLFFGGMLWPIAWLWAYSKPVLYKMAYGTDAVKHGEEPVAPAAPAETASAANASEPEVVAESAPRVTRTTARERRPWEA
ncbi:MAG TPA: DUF3302 domain-containing protein [Steroidobacteraceae bacterium]|nr:DUF3302 domain-containing protein [Steroidobacteraceae bacterium]